MVLLNDLALAVLTGQLTFVDPFQQLSRSYGTYMTKGPQGRFCGLEPKFGGISKSERKKIIEIAKEG